MKSRAQRASTELFRLPLFSINCYNIAIDTRRRQSPPKLLWAPAPATARQQRGCHGSSHELWQVRERADRVSPDLMSVCCHCLRAALSANRTALRMLHSMLWDGSCSDEEGAGGSSAAAAAAAPPVKLLDATGEHRRLGPMHAELARQCP